MHRIDVIVDMGQEYFMDDDNVRAAKKSRPMREKSIKIKDELFEKALRKGLIEKTQDGYIFIGSYEEILRLQNKKS